MIAGSGPDLEEKGGREAAVKVKIRRSSLKGRKTSGFRAKSKTKGGRKALKKARTKKKQKPARRPQPKSNRK